MSSDVPFPFKMAFGDFLKKDCFFGKIIPFKNFQHIICDQKDNINFWRKIHDSSKKGSYIPLPKKKVFRSFLGNTFFFQNIVE